MLEKLGKSPAGAEATYNSDDDTCTLQYHSYKLIYSNRKKGYIEKLPYCFKDCKRINND